MSDFYQILGIDKNASADEVKKAYRKMAQKYHPDKNPGNKSAEETFKKASEAYEILSDPQKKAQYDQFGSVGGAGGFGGSGFGGGGFQGFSQEDMGGFGDIFETFFGGSGGFGGGGGRRKTSKRGADLEANVHITFEQSVSGVTKELNVTKHEVCGTCSGSGSRTGKRQTCTECHGTGQTARVQNTPLGAMRFQQTCSKCQGEGEILSDPCSNCHGDGRVRIPSQLKIKIPAGIQNGTTMRLSGKGDAGKQSGSAGDLFIHVHVAESKDFIRRDDDVFSHKEIHILQAILGDEVEVKTVHGNVKLKIPAGTQNEKMFRLKDYGMPIANAEGRKGNHYVTIRVHVPEKLTGKEKELYGQLVKEAGLKIQPEEKGVFDKFWK